MNLFSLRKIYKKIDYKNEIINKMKRKSLTENLLLGSLFIQFRLNPSNKTTVRNCF